MRSLLATLMLIAGPAAAAPITIGGTVFPLGEAAFPSGSSCIDAGGCSGDTLLVDASLNPVPREDALLGHDLSLVAINLDETDVYRLVFPEPIVNLSGDDLYLAQAEFTGYMDLEDGIHALQIRFDNSATWYTLGTDQFARDSAAGAPIVTILDPEPVQAGYFLWFTTQDLADFGFAEGESIQGFDVRGPAGGGLDLAIAGNLNVPEPGTAALLAAGILGLALARRRGAT